MGEKLKKIISRLESARIMVIGDVMLDEFIWGTVSRISPEAPVPVVWVNSETFMAGGSGNVASNIASLKAKVYISGIVGDDEKGRLLISSLSKQGVDTGGIFTDAKRPTTSKSRIIAHHQQVVRMDREKIDDVPKDIIKKMVSYVVANISKVDAIIIEDYGKGVVSPYLLKEVVGIARKNKKILTIDPKEEHFSYYKGATCITPNRQEAQIASGIKIKDRATFIKAGQLIMKKLDCETVLITLGEEGMCLLERSKKTPLLIPTVAQDVFDVSGAGDTVISLFTAALCCGASYKEAAQISNYAAGIVVGKVGTATVTKKELLDRIEGIKK